MWPLQVPDFRIQGIKHLVWAAPIALGAMDLDIKQHEQQYIGRGPTGLGVYHAR